MGVGGLGAAFVLRPAHAPATPAPVTFSSFTPKALAKGGVELTTPQGASSDGEGNAAEAAARKEFGGPSPVVEPHFAHCTDTRKVHLLNEDCWAVALNGADVAAPGGTPPGGPPAKPLKWFIVLVEPGTDKILDAQGGG